MRTIGVLLHEEQSWLFRQNFILWSMCREWESRGIRVNVFSEPEPEMDVDLLIPHIDLTVLPPAYQAAIDTAPLAVNRNVRNISKSAFSRHIVRPGDGYSGPVIVKTDLNCGGIREQGMTSGPPAPRTGAPGRWRRAWERIHPNAEKERLGRVLGGAEFLCSNNYPIFRSAADVPPQVHRNEALIAERFLPERDGDLYCVRSYVFFGSAGYCTLKKSPHPVVKGRRVTYSARVAVPEEIVELRHRMQFDYGKFDFVNCDGELVLLDVNRTPTFAGKTLTDRRKAKSAILVEGLGQWQRDG